MLSCHSTNGQGRIQNFSFFDFIFFKKKEVIAPNYTMTKANREGSHLNSPPQGVPSPLRGVGETCVPLDVVSPNGIKLTREQTDRPCKHAGRKTTGYYLKASLSLMEKLGMHADATREGTRCQILFPCWRLPWRLNAKQQLNPHSCVWKKFWVK